MTGRNTVKAAVVFLDCFHFGRLFVVFSLVRCIFLFLLNAQKGVYLMF